MTRAKPVRSRRKGGVSENFQHIKHALADLQRAASGVGKFAGQLSVRAPVYAASAGLAYVYAWGFFSTFPVAFAVGLTGVVIMGEFLKPRLLELIEDRLREGAGAKCGALIVAAALCVAIGGGGGFVALNAAEAPTRTFEQASRAVREIRAENVEIDRLIGLVPPVPTNIPAERIEALGGAEKLRADRAAEIARLERRKRPEPVAVRPAVAVPPIDWRVKVALILAIEFVIFVVPWGSRRTEGRRPVAIAKTEIPAAATGAQPARVNDGGWATRIARYGPSGRKPTKSRFGVVKGGKV